MTRLRIAISRFLGIFGRAQQNQEIEREFRSHLQMLTEENVQKEKSALSRWDFLIGNVRRRD